MLANIYTNASNMLSGSHTGTLFLELWKRRSATLAYEWDVDTFEEDEIDRPDFQGQAIKVIRRLYVA